MKSVTICGTRPQLIKISPLWAGTIINTGQHWGDMNDPFIKERKLKVRDLGKTQLGEMIDSLIEVIEEEKADRIIVIGDTRSTLAGAIAAKYTNCQLVHIEAGLRSGSNTQIEERIRKSVDRLADVKFCPDSNSERNLLEEGIYDQVYVVGDPEFDSMLELLPIPKWKQYRKFIFMTLHRPENVDDPKRLKAIIEAIKESGEEVIFPIHPRTKKKLEEFNISLPDNIIVKEPLGYRDCIYHIANAKRIITDSGGVTREAHWLLGDLIILRDTTEWKEITKSQRVRLCSPSKLLNAIRDDFPKAADWKKPEKGANKRIKEILGD